jgi:transketolase
LSAYVPVFDDDVAAVVTRAGAASRPAYIRLGRGEAPAGYAVKPYAPWRQLTYGDGPVVIVVGPLAGTYIAPFEEMSPGRRPNLWAVAELPLECNALPGELVDQISSASALCVAEEHVRRGGFGAELTLHLADEGIAVRHFRHLYARAHYFERYGSQPFLRHHSALDAGSMLAALDNMG